MPETAGAHNDIQAGIRIDIAACNAFNRVAFPLRVAGNNTRGPDTLLQPSPGPLVQIIQFFAH